jgi:hypothetical protein
MLIKKDIKFLDYPVKLFLKRFPKRQKGDSLMNQKTNEHTMITWWYTEWVTFD